MSKHLSRQIKSRKSSSSQKILTKKKQSKERLMIRSISLRLVRYNASIIENRKVLAETASQTYTIDLRLYQVLEILPTNFIQISQSEIININSISHLKPHAQRSGRNFLEKRKLHLLFTPLPKNHQGEIRTMKNKYLTMQLPVFLSASSSLSSFHSFMHQIPTHH